MQSIYAAFCSGVLLLFAFAMLSVGMLIGSIVRTPDAVMGVAFLAIFPMTFMSNVFVPVGGVRLRKMNFAGL